MSTSDTAGPAVTWPTLLSLLVQGRDLTPAQAAWAMEQVMTGEATPAQVAGLVMTLRAKGESPDEVSGFVDTMLLHAEQISVPGPIVDTCGTGGDRAHTVNISTMAAMVVAGAGARVVKHGNRAASSSCGSADLLEELGVVVDLEPAKVVACAARVGVAFCFAPRFHPALRHAAVTRRDLGVATIFNFLGPLANPARPGHQAVGVADERMAGVMAEVLASRGTSALVFRGEDGLDELTTAGRSQIWKVWDGQVTRDTVHPDEVGLALGRLEDLRGGDAAHNAAVTLRLLAGEQGPVRDAVLLNSAAALVSLAQTTEPLADQLVAAMAVAAASLDSGAARAALDGWVETSQELAAQPR